jgi:hypothetical protein
MAQANLATRPLATPSTFLALPVEQRAIITRSLLANLAHKFDDSAANIVIELISLDPDGGLSDGVLGVLSDRVVSGNARSVAELVRHSAVIATRLLAVATDRLLMSARHALKLPGGLVIGFATTVQTSGLDLPPGPTLLNTESVAVQWLLFAKHVSAIHAIGRPLDALFKAALCLLGILGKSVALAARDLIVSLSHHNSVGLRCGPLLQPIALALITAPDASLHQTLGFSLWLTSIATSDTSDALVFNVTQEGYWQPVANGLRHGDTERRKLCLDILRVSVAKAVQLGRLDLVTDNKNSKSLSLAISQPSAVVMLAHHKAPSVDPLWKVSWLTAKQQSHLRLPPSTTGTVQSSRH